ncbi:protein PAT1 homolog 1 isoform X1 [Drosophila miranda]|uniref:protein PAT1 homolog 1 isoform X1 n=1 Tax=Drosophila miranda TaxID=7229 RepID=UPI0007E618AD|nr:protein PAT1 homolog 1 isoform X1 [Drosophila miranda]
MDNSFFGFDTTIPEDEGGDGRVGEEEYDALNDETFGSAINGDWEEAHETLVRLGGNGDKVRKRGGFADRSAFGGFSAGGNGVPSHTNVLSSAPSSSGSTPAPFNAPFPGTRNMEDADLELNLSSMKLDDVDISSFLDSEVGNLSNRINLDSAVWASPPFPNNQPLFQEGFRSAFRPQTQMKLQQEANANLALHHMHPQAGPKISTLEDIERNLIIQQAIPKLQQQQQPKDRKAFDEFSLANRQHVLPSTIPLQQQQQQQPKPQNKGEHIQNNLHTPAHAITKLIAVPPGFLTAPQISPPRTNLGFHGPHPLPEMLPNPQSQQQLNGLAGNRVPPGFIYPPGLPGSMPQLQQYPLLQQHGACALPPNFPLAGNQRPLPTPHLPTALNNFAMHPSFNAMRAAGLHPAAFMQPAHPLQHPQSRMPPHPLQAANNLLNQQQNSMFNMFNMRLVQEIQQNHPLLQQNAVVARQLQQSRGGSVPIDQRQKQQLQQQQLNRRPDASGNLPQDEYDEYANLMSTRDKHWLIGIQLSQLNTDTPYIDDYYYTVYRERKALQNGQVRHSQAHKDNQLNHPLTQPRGHAQLVLVQLGNKNGTRNGHGQNRERRNSENTNTCSTGVSTNNAVSGSGGTNNTLPGYIFSPLKFENSLGKLQYGSVTAPRKIIDADIMGGEASLGDIAGSSATSSMSTMSGVNAKSNAGTPLLPSACCDITPSSMRKSRDILLLIETLYRYLLKLEDLENTNVMATIVLKKKKEAERIAALEQLEMANKTPEERAAEASNPQSINPQLNNKFNYEIETTDALVNKLKSGLAFDKVVAMMNVRKGKILLRRIMPFLTEHSVCWTVWSGVFCSLQTVVKKDKDDFEGVLYALYPEFKKHISKASFETVVTISAAITRNDNKLTGIFCSRFGILSLVALILRAQEIYVSKIDPTLSDANRQEWRKFLAQVASCLTRTIQNQTISAAIESDAIQPLMDHFENFKDLKLDALLALITEARHQID